MYAFDNVDNSGRPLSVPWLWVTLSLRRTAVYRGRTSDVILHVMFKHHAIVGDIITNNV